MTFETASPKNTSSRRTLFTSCLLCEIRNTYTSIITNNIEGKIEGKRVSFVDQLKNKVKVLSYQEMKYLPCDRPRRELHWETRSREENVRILLFQVKNSLTGAWWRWRRDVSTAARSPRARGARGRTWPAAPACERSAAWMLAGRRLSHWRSGLGSSPVIQILLFYCVTGIYRELGRLGIPSYALLATASI